MSDDSMNYTNPLSGTEVVSDICGQVRRRLSSDCNLRDSDGYSGGYSGEVTVKLSLHSVKTVEVEMTIPIFQSPSITAPAPSDIPPELLDAVEVEESITIDIEPNLIAVRDRIADNSEDSIKAEASEPVPESEEEVRTKRKYQRRTALVGATEE